MGPAEAERNPEQVDAAPPASEQTAPKKKWKFLTNEEIVNFLKSQGSSQERLRKHLFDSNLYCIDRKKGKEHKSYREDVSHRGLKFSIGYIRLWISAFLAQQDESFTWEEYVPSVMEIPEARVGDWPNIVKGIYEKLERLCLGEILKNARKRFTDNLWKTGPKAADQDSKRMEVVEEPVREEQQADSECEMEVEDDDEDEEEDEDEDYDEDEKDMPGFGGRKRRVHYPVLQIFIEDMLLGLGLMRSEVERKYVSSTHEFEIGLDQKLALLKNKIVHKTSTYRGYVRSGNLFLLWLNDKEPQLWEESGMLLANQHNVYAFLEELRTGKIRSSGEEPPISHVLNGTAIFERRSDLNSPLSCSNGAKFLTGLSFLYDAQQTLINAPRVETLRSFRTFSLWESNLQFAETNRRQQSFQDRQKNVFATECPLACKRRHSVHLLMEDTWLSIRNRALSLCQAFSISRFDELSKWSISDLHVFNYSSQLPTVGDQDIQVVYAHQAEHKCLKDGRAPDEKLIVRHRDLLLCPFSALASMMFERFVCASEKPVDLTNMESWYNVKVFRTVNDSEKAIPRNSAYEQRKEMMENTATATSGCVNHYDRKLGALIARLHGVRNSELKALGLWETGVLDKHYSKFALPDTVAKLSGFNSAHNYFLPRARADPMQFQEIYGGASMFGSFFPFLDDPTVFQSVLEKRSEGNNTCFNVYQTLHFIRTTFWQDLPHYYALYPQLKIFKSNVLISHWGTFMQWVDYVNKQSCSSLGHPKMPMYKAQEEDQETESPELEKWKAMVESSIAELRRISDTNSAKLDRLLHAVESHGAYGKRKREAGTELKKRLNDGGQQILRKLRDLNEMSIRDVYEEWNVKVISEGVQYCPLKEFEQRRTELGEQYRSKNLKTSIVRRRQLCYFVDQTSNEFGNLERAFEWIEDLQLKLGGGKPCSLHKLWKHIRDY